MDVVEMRHWETWGYCRGKMSSEIWREKYKDVPRDENGEGNDTPLQYSCLENPMDGGAW